MKKKIFKIILFLTLLIVTSIYTIKWLSNKEIDLDNNTIELLLESSDNIEPKNRVVNTIVNTIKNTELINPISNIINHYNGNIEELDTIKVIKEENKTPIVYIYNTHQTEKYNSSKEINLNYSVIDASFYLQKKLKEYGIEAFVEEMSIQDILSTNNWSYASSYKVSRMFMEKRKKDNNNLKYYIDIHRDSVKKNISTVSINGKEYAKTMFLLGLENPKYKNNEENINKLEIWLNNNYQGLSWGIYKKQGKGVNGVYNQDFSSNVFLIEIGGEENTYEEVENTIDVIAEMLNYYIGGKLE